MSTMLDKNNIISQLVGFLFILMALTDISHSRGFILASAILSIVIFILCFPVKDRNYFSESMLLILLLLITSIVNLFFTQNNLGGSIALLGNLLLTFIYFQIDDSKKLTPWVIGAYAVTILFIGYNLFVLNVHANDIYEGLSRNHAGFAVIFWTIFLLFHLKVAHNRFPLLPPIIGMILAFFLFGRTSLIVSALLFAIVFYYKFKNNLKIRIISMSLFIGSCLFLWFEFGTLLTNETNLGAGLDTPRWELWRIYFENINFANLFTGIDVLELDPLFNQFNGNPHNSFIKFHSRVGIGSIVFIMLFVNSTFHYLKVKENYIFWLLMLLTLRALFDSDIFIGNFDFIFFIVTFYWIKHE